MLSHYKPLLSRGFSSNLNPTKYEKYTFPRHKWTEEELDVKITHHNPETISDYAALGTVKALRLGWDLISGYKFGHQLGWFAYTEKNWIKRVIFLESVAACPGFVFGMLRHLKSLRRIQRDKGWINSLLSEAENERIHLLTAMSLHQPGFLFRMGIMGAQGIMVNFLFVGYLINSRYCHRIVGYVEEEACITYTQLLKDIDEGKLPEFEKETTELAKKYWQLEDNATWRDVWDNIRADEAEHRIVNHTLAPLSKDPNAANPFRNDIF